jgi:hypothetical protein
MEELIGMIAVTGFFGSIITWIYMYYKSKHQQRMALIESGTSADIFTERSLDNKSTALKYGMLLTGIGLGFFLGILSERMFGLDDGQGIFPLIFVGGGIGLILFYNVMAKKED